MTDEAKALVERLRSVDISWSETGEWCAEAADLIEQLEREKAVVSDLWEQQKEIALGYLADCNKAADRIEELDRHLTLSGEVGKALSERIEALEAENERLRGAVVGLMEIAEMAMPDTYFATDTRVNAARAALGEKQ